MKLSNYQYLFNKTYIDVQLFEDLMKYSLSYNFVEFLQIHKLAGGDIDGQLHNDR